MAAFLDLIAGYLAEALDATFAAGRPEEGAAAVRRPQWAARSLLSPDKPRTDTVSLRANALESALAVALDRGEFAVHYQPQACLESGRIVAVEALLRWHSADFGRVPPDTFIPLAEHSGLILRLGEWVLSEACAQQRRWQSKGLPPVRVAVNVSPFQLRDHGFVSTVRQVLDVTRIEPDLLELELTESHALHDDSDVARAVDELRAMGVAVALDDFGTGFSSLAYLKRMRVDTIKIDRSFVRNLASDRVNATIVAGVLAIGRGLGLRVVAEGVEHDSELAFLRKHDCRYVQGYLTGRPEPADEIGHLLRAGGAVCRGRFAFPD